MLLWQKGVIIGIKQSDSHKEVVEIRNPKTNEVRLGINYPYLTGECRIGDEVLLNSTAVELKLGTGGYDFIIANISQPPIDRKISDGHIIKNRYTPLQYAIQSGEELVDSDRFNMYSSLEGTPVLIISLHSMLPILTILIKDKKPTSKIVYIMTDATSLPIWLSEHVDVLKAQQLIYSTITIGQSFGGDIEAINKYSGLLLAKEMFEADFIIIGPGPGSVGTASDWGFSAVEVGELINATNILSGNPIVVPRISFQDVRLRHYGISHHLLTSLSKIALTKSNLPLPLFNDERQTLLNRQVLDYRLAEKHELHWRVPSSERELENKIRKYDLMILTMGRSIEQDPSFFQAVGIAADYAIRI